MAAIVVQLGLAMMPLGGLNRVLWVDLRDHQRNVRVRPPGGGVVDHDGADCRHPGCGDQRGCLPIGEEREVEAGEVCGGGVLDDDLVIAPWETSAR